jgi:glycosyltransferase involved in cell wall biosynthesis
MKVAIRLIGTYPPPYGGVSVHIKRLQIALRQRDLDVTVLADPGTIAEDDRVVPTRLGPGWYLRQLLSREAALLHFHTSGLDSRTLGFLSLLAWLGKPVVVTLHSFRHEAPLPALPWRSTPPLALRAFPHIIAVGPEVRDRIVALGVSPGRTSVIPSYLSPLLNERDRRQIDPGVDRFLRSREPILTANAYRLVFFEGEDLYGLDLCVELCRRLAPHYPRLGFLFALPAIGDADYYAAIQRRIADYHLEDHFHFSHTAAEYWPIIERSSVLVRPTNSDSYGVSVAEALDLGVPAIASDVCRRPPGTVLFRSRDLQDLLEKTRGVLDDLSASRQQTSWDGGCEGDAVDRILAVYRSVLRPGAELPERG